MHKFFFGVLLFSLNSLGQSYWDPVSHYFPKGAKITIKKDLELKRKENSSDKHATREVLKDGRTCDFTVYSDDVQMRTLPDKLNLDMTKSGKPRVYEIQGSALYAKWDMASYKDSLFVRKNGKNTWADTADAKACLSAYTEIMDTLHIQESKRPFLREKCWRSESKVAVRIPTSIPKVYVDMVCEAMGVNKDDVLSSISDLVEVTYPKSQKIDHKPEQKKKAKPAGQST